MSSQRIVAYPGITGVIGFLSDEARQKTLSLSAAERDVLRADVQDVLDKSPDHALFLDDLVRSAELLRGWRALADENRLSARRDNLRRYIRSHSGKVKAAIQLSVVNRMAMSALARSPSLTGASNLELATTLLSRLLAARSGRGDRPHDELDGAAIMVREAYQRHTNHRASATKDGDFIALLNAIVEVAIGKRRKDMHRVAERVLAHGHFVQESPGVSLLVAPRLSD